MALGEMTVFAPISGGWVSHVRLALLLELTNQADRWFHPSVGFGLGWINVLHGFFSTPSELVTASILCSYWDTAFPPANQAAYIVAFIIAITALVSYKVSNADVELSGGKMVGRVRVCFRYHEDRPCRRFK